MVIESEVFGSGSRVIDITVELNNEDGWISRGREKTKLLGAQKAFKDWRLRVVMVPGIGRYLECFGNDLRIRNPL